MVPSSQKAADRPIGFMLVDHFNGDTVPFDLIIRPEDLVRNDPSRMTATQTLGGAWVDNFGPGLGTINISGTTGWRGSPSADGVALFLAMKDTVYTGWHRRRAAAIAAGSSPDMVELSFSDALDRDVSVVAPMQFTLRRSKSRPLLMMYQISLLVVGDQVGTPLPSLATSFGGGAPESIGDLLAFGSDVSLGIASLTDSIASLGSFINFAAYLPVAIAQEALFFVGGALGVFNTVVGAVLEAGGVVGQGVADLIGIAAGIAVAGVNAFYGLLAPLTDLNAVAYLDYVASQFLNVFCTLQNSFIPYLVYRDITDLFGASNCSSTSGGSPLSPLRGLNPFDVLSDNPVPLIAVSAVARSAVNNLMAYDPVFGTMTSVEIGSYMGAAGAGMSLP